MTRTVYSIKFRNPLCEWQNTLNFVAQTKCHEILYLKQHAQYPCRWIGRSEPVLRPARNAERVEDLPGLTRRKEVVFAVMRDHIADLAVCTELERHLDACWAYSSCAR